MAPKKAQKMSLNEFLVNDTLGSWADEMDALPTAPAARADDDRGHPSDRRRDDYLSSRPDRASGPFREDLPLPTEPPFTAFIGNLAFDLTEGELEEFFAGQPTKSVKIIKDRDDKPKGFGYIEFATLDGLKEALAKSGTSFAGRNIRVSVAEPPKERSGFGGRGGFDDDDSKFSGNWRRDGPLPDLPGRDGTGRRDGPPAMSREPPPPSVSDNASDWRSSRPPARASSGASPDFDAGGPSFKRRGSGFRDISSGAADAEDKWSIGSKFQPAAPSESSGSRFGRPRADMGPPRDPAGPPEEDNWRKAHPTSRNSTSPSGSTPPTPQLARRKLELLPRTGSASASPSPLASPSPSATSQSRSNPFGAAKPVDVTAREAVITERIEKERETVKDRVQHTISRTSSKAGSHRGTSRDSAPPSIIGSPTTSESRTLPPASNVRPSFSFASAAAGKKDTPDESTDAVEEIVGKLEEAKI